MRIIIDALIGAVVAIITGFFVGLCVVGIEAVSGSRVSGPAAAATVAAAFTWAIIVMAKGGGDDT